MTEEVRSVPCVWLLRGSLPKSYGSDELALLWGALISLNLCLEMPSFVWPRLVPSPYSSRDFPSLPSLCMWAVAGTQFPSSCLPALFTVKPGAAACIPHSSNVDVRRSSRGRSAPASSLPLLLGPEEEWGLPHLTPHSAFEICPLALCPLHRWRVRG